MAIRRVVFVANYLPLLATAFNHVIEDLVDSGYEVEILVPSPLDGETWLGPLASRCRVRRLPFDRNRLRLFGALRGTLSVAGRILRGRNEIFAFLTVLPILMGGPLARILGRPSVYLLTGMGTVFSAQTLRWRVIRTGVKRLYSFLFRGSRSRVLVQNSEDARYVEPVLRVPTNSVHLIPGCGAPTASFPFFETLPDNPRPVILVPARVILEKGILEAIEASRLLRERGIDHEFRFTSGIDPGNPLPLSEDQIQALREDEHLRFLGFQESIVPQFEACDIVCLPSYREGLPRVLVEAAATGRPMVTTDVIGCREVVEDGVTGLLVPPRSGAALADALQRLIEDRELAEQLRRNAHDLYQREFQPEREIRQFATLFRQLGLEPRIR